MLPRPVSPVHVLPLWSPMRLSLKRLLQPWWPRQLLSRAPLLPQGRLEALQASMRLGVLLSIRIIMRRR